MKYYKWMGAVKIPCEVYEVWRKKYVEQLGINLSKSHATKLHYQKYVWRLKKKMKTQERET